MNRISLSSARKRKRERESKIEIKQDPTATHEAQKIQLFEEASIVRYRNKIFFPSSFPRFQFKEDKFNSRPRHEISSSEDVLFELRARFYIQIFADKGLAPRYTHTHAHIYTERRKFNLAARELRGSGNVASNSSGPQLPLNRQNLWNDIIPVDHHRWKYTDEWGQQFNRAEPSLNPSQYLTHPSVIAFSTYLPFVLFFFFFFSNVTQRNTSFFILFSASFVSKVYGVSQTRDD